MWTIVDQAAREMTGQPLAGNEAKGLGVVQFLTQKDITFNPTKGWTGYPDFAPTVREVVGRQRLITTLRSQLPEPAPAGPRHCGPPVRPASERSCLSVCWRSPMCR